MRLSSLNIGIYYHLRFHTSLAVVTQDPQGIDTYWNGHVGYVP